MCGPGRGVRGAALCGGAVNVPGAALHFDASWPDEPSKALCDPLWAPDGEAVTRVYRLVTCVVCRDMMGRVLGAWSDDAVAVDGTGEPQAVVRDVTCLHGHHPPATCPVCPGRL